MNKQKGYLKCKTVAHRGCTINKDIENTEQAFIKAGKGKFWAIETDIYPTKDGLFICNHDDYIKGQTKKICEMKYSEIMEINLSFDSKTINVCSFEKYLMICKKYNKNAHLELKSSHNIEEIKHILEIIIDFGMEKHTQVISFNLQNLLNIKILNEKHGWEFVTHHLVCDEKLLYEALEHNINVSVDYKICTKELVNKYKQKGLLVTIWTLNDETLVEYYLSMGVDIITSDFLECDPIYMN